MSPFIYAALFATALFTVSTNVNAAAHRIRSQCDNEPTQAATFGCYTKLAGQLRNEIESAFRQRLAEASTADADARSSDHDGPHLAEGVRLSQVAWDNYVDAECGFEGQTSFGGSGDDILQMACRARLDMQRLTDLNAAHHLLQR